MTTESPARTAERIDLLSQEFADEMKARHQNRYRWARDVIRERFVRAGAVIDFATGTGYGAAILREVSDLVYGRDKDATAIAIANARHSSTAVNFSTNPVTFHYGDQEHFFDAVVSIETIEHLEEAHVDSFLETSRHLLIPGGLLIVSTPEARPDRVVENTYHLREYTREELKLVIEKAGFVLVRWDDWLPGFLCVVSKRPA